MKGKFMGIYSPIFSMSSFYVLGKLFPFIFLILSVCPSKSLIPTQSLNYHQHVRYVQLANDDKLNFMDSTYSAGHCSKHLTCISVFNPHNHLLSLCLFYGEGHRCSDRLKDLPKFSAGERQSCVSPQPFSGKKGLCERRFYLDLKYLIFKNCYFR